MIRALWFVALLGFLPACGGQPPEPVAQEQQGLNWCNGQVCPSGTYCDGTSCVASCRCSAKAHSRATVCNDDGSCTLACVYPWLDWNGVYSDGCEHYGIYCYSPDGIHGVCCYEGDGHCWSS